MALTNKHKKHIACLESLWNDDIENRLSVAPILELLSKRDGIKFALLTCNTKEELEHNLNLLHKKRGYGILYLAFHGKPGRIFLDETSVDIETLARMMGEGFNNWIVYFGSCATMNVKEDRILNFINLTRTSLVIGYDRYVDWVISTATDLLLLDKLQFYRDMKKFWKTFRRTYRGMAELIGLKAFHN